MAVLADIVFDCVHPASVARFWADVLDGYEVAPYDDPEIERLRAMGIDDIEDDPTVLVTGPGPRFIFQRVPEPKTVKNRVHLDVHASGGPDTDREIRRERVAAEVARLGAAGATVFREVDEMGEHWVVMQDPEGNEFCVQ